MKKILLSLFVGFIGIISFCSSFYYFTNQKETVSVGRYANNVVVFSGYLYDRHSWCFTPDHSSVTCSFKRMSDGYTISNINSSSLFCAFNNHAEGDVLINVICSNSSSSSHNINWAHYNLEGYLNEYLNYNCPSCPSCQICTGYNFSVFDNGSRIVNSPINTDINLYMQGSLFFTDLVSPDGDYVIESSCSTGNDCPEISGSNCYSLYINDIQHEGSSIIDITIPEEISWDYSRSNDVFSVVVSGYNTDPAYIQSVIDVQNYQPTSDDFSKLVGLFGSYGGLLIACLFVIIVFYLIKKMFK